jgi:hypothetical protein
MNTDKQTLQRVQGSLYHLRRGLAPYVEVRMKARHGAHGCPMPAAPSVASRAAASTSMAC